MKARWKIIVVLVALVFVSGYAGGLIGAADSAPKSVAAQPSEAWNVSAMNTLERRLKLTPEQREKIQAIIDAAWSS